MIRLCASFAGLLLAALLWAGAAAAVPAATDVRLGVHPGKTRLVIDLSEKVDYSVFSLRDPYRIVIDMPNISWQAPTSRVAWARWAPT